jgi:hypothetical protein
MFDGIETRYDVAQVCRRGHLINSSTEDSPERNMAFCSTCGQKTIIACERCATPIHGQYHNVNVGFRAMEEPPAFCHACGKPYPWTAEGIDSARALAEELEGLNEADRIAIASTIEDLVVESPRTSVAVLRFKKLIARATGPARELLLDLIAKIAVESAAASLGAGSRK